MDQIAQFDEVQTKSLNPDPEPEIHLFDFFMIFTRRWRLIAGITLLATVLMLVKSLLGHDIYKAEVVVLPSSQETSSASALLSQMSGLTQMMGMGAGGGLKDRTSLYLWLFKPARSKTRSSSVLDLINAMARTAGRRLVKPCWSTYISLRTPRAD